MRRYLTLIVNLILTNLTIFIKYYYQVWISSKFYYRRGSLMTCKKLKNAVIATATCVGISTLPSFLMAGET